jgi:hypothetical protein
MARITSYSLDQTLTSGDKVVGTDATTGTVRNYTVGELSTFINTANLGNYTFDTTQTPGSGTDNFVLTYDNSTGKISLEVAASQAAFNIVEDLTPQLGGTLDANSQIIDMGANTITDTKVGQWDTAYGWGDHSTASYLTSETSHTDVLVDGDFGTAGLMTTNGSGTYSITTNNSSNWNTAYGWGDHSTEGYVTTSGVTGVTGTAPVVSSGGTAPAISMAAATTSVNGYLTSTDWSTFNTGAGLAATANQNSTATILGGNLTGTVNSVAVATVTSGAALGATAQQPPSEGAFVDGDKTKLDAIEASADVTDATNVTAAGALMDSEMTDLAGVKGVTISTLQVKPSEGAFANGDKTKLDAIEAGADVTDATNVTAAGALMDSEVTNLAAVKAFATTDYATAAQGLTADAALPKAGGAMTGAITGNQDITGKRPIVTDTTQTINLTLGTHEGSFIYSNNGAAVAVNILPNSTQAFPVGTEIDIIQAGGGQVTATPGIGVNLNGANTAIPITAQWGGATLKQITADNWIIVGKI